MCGTFAQNFPSGPFTRSTLITKGLSRLAKEPNVFEARSIGKLQIVLIGKISRVRPVPQVPWAEFDLAIHTDARSTPLISTIAFSHRQKDGIGFAVGGYRHGDLHDPPHLDFGGSSLVP